MRLNANSDARQIEADLLLQARQVYGDERTDEIASQIQHLARMLAEIGQRELDLRDAPPEPGLPMGGDRT